MQTYQAISPSPSSRFCLVLSPKQTGYSIVFWNSRSKVQTYSFSVKQNFRINVMLVVEKFGTFNDTPCCQNWGGIIYFSTRERFEKRVLVFISPRWLESVGLTKNLAQHRNISIHYPLSIEFLILKKKSLKLRAYKFI